MWFRQLISFYFTTIFASLTLPVHFTIFSAPPTTFIIILSTSTLYTPVYSPSIGL